MVALLSIAFFPLAEIPQLNLRNSRIVKTFPFSSIITSRFPTKQILESESTLDVSNRQQKPIATLKPQKQVNDDTIPFDNSISKLRNKDVISRQYIHFIHIPKCGGTTMTIILRQMQCVRDPLKNVDCCTNPGKANRQSYFYSETA